MAARLLLLLLAVVSAAAMHARAPLRGMPIRHVAASPSFTRTVVPTMGNNAPEGPFTPIVLAGKVVLGEKTFNKIRGKAIGIHSQIITEFCEDYGVPRQMR
eukprot:169743-Pleurochrysis_carterae.AAC.3